MDQSSILFTAGTQPSCQHASVSGNSTGGFSWLHQHPLIGYSHGGGTIYSLANQIVNDGIIPRLIRVSQTIYLCRDYHAVGATDTDNSLFSASPLTTAPGGVLAERSIIISHG